MKKEILFQMDTAWRLFQYHCDGLGEEEAARFLYAVISE